MEAQQQEKPTDVQVVHGALRWGTGHTGACEHEGGVWVKCASDCPYQALSRIAYERDTLRAELGEIREALAMDPGDRAARKVRDLVAQRGELRRDTVHQAGLLAELRDHLRQAQEAFFKLHATLQAREEEIRTWRAASGLEVDGSTDAVMPEHLLADLKARELELAEEAKKRAAALAQVATLREALASLIAVVEDDEHFHDPAGDPDAYAALVNARAARDGTCILCERTPCACPPLAPGNAPAEVARLLGVEAIEPAARCAECSHHRVHHDESLPEGEQCGALAEVNTADCDCLGFTESEP